jgi:hypothetical protein
VTSTSIVRAVTLETVPLQRARHIRILPHLVLDQHTVAVALGVGGVAETLRAEADRSTTMSAIDTTIRVTARGDREVAHRRRFAERET